MENRYRHMRSEARALLQIEFGQRRKHPLHYTSLGTQGVHIVT